MEIVEVGPRDGLQNESAVVATFDKIAYIELLIAAGLRRIEAVSFVRPDRVPQMADAEAVMAGVPRRSDVRYIGLVMNRRGVQRAVACGVDEANIVVVATETFSQRNQGMSIDASLAGLEGLVDEARRSGLSVTVTVGASYGCPFEGEVSTAQVMKLVRRANDLDVQEIALADTIGVGTPADTTRLMDAARAVTDKPLRLHLHNTRNTGYANAYTAVAAGVSALDASSGGIGGCPFAPKATGNIATEDLNYLLERTGTPLGLSHDELVAAASFITEKLSIATPALLGRAGWFPAASYPESIPGTSAVSV
ncbi:MAG: hydroxymethylglutaryl-CoA lyase [Acidimicrobiales bacterium]